MGRSQETYNKKEVRSKKEKKRKEKEKNRLARRENEKKGSLDDMLAYVDENGMITSIPPDPEKKKVEVKLEDIEIVTARREAEDEPDPIRKGTVTYYNDSKGYGFIRDAETKDSVFVHINNVIDEITDGDKVTFEVEMGPRGLSAIEVKLT